jgi:hypothetical protein
MTKAFMDASDIKGRGEGVSRFFDQAGHALGAIIDPADG